MLGAVGAERPEDLVGPGLRRRGEREEREVRLEAARGEAAQDLGHAVVLMVVVRIVDGPIAEDRLEVDRRLTRLRGVRFVDDHRIRAVLQHRSGFGELAEDVGELLQLGDDDPCLLALQLLAQLRRGLVDLAHRSGHLLKRLDLRL